MPYNQLSNENHYFSLTQPFWNGQTIILMNIWCHICIHSPWKPPERHLICQNWTRSRDYMTWKGAKLTEILKITFFARIRFYFFSFNEIQTPTWSSLWWHMSNPMHIFFGSDLISGPLCPMNMYVEICENQSNWCIKERSWDKLQDMMFVSYGYFLKTFWNLCIKFKR